MVKITTLTASALFILTFGLQVVAAQAPQTSGSAASASTASAVEKADKIWDAMRSSLAAAKSVRYTLVATVTGKGKQAKKWTAVCALQRPDLMSMSIRCPGGSHILVLSDGMKLHVYDSSSKRLATQDAAPFGRLFMTLAGFFTNQGREQDSEYLSLIPMSSMLFDTDLVPADLFKTMPRNYGLNVDSTTLNGVPVDRIVVSEPDHPKTGAFRLWFDERSRLIVRVEASPTPDPDNGDKVTLTVTYAYLGNSPIARTTFAFNKPAGAKEVTMAPSMTPEMPQLTAAQKAAKAKAVAIMKHMVSLYDKAQALQFDAQVVDRRAGAAVYATTRQITCSVSRPNRVRIEATFSDNTSLLADYDGTSLYMYDPTALKYTKDSGPAGFNTLWRLMLPSSEALGVQTRWMHMYYAETDPLDPLMYPGSVDQMFDYGIPSVKDVKLNGVDCYRIAQSVSQAGMQVDQVQYIDKRTGLLCAAETGSTYENRPAEHHVTYTNMRLIATALPADTFAFTPPANAALVSIPPPISEPSAQPVAVTPPQPPATTTGQK